MELSYFASDFLFCKNTEFVRLGQEFLPFEKGISIDLMPFDNVPDGWLSRRTHFLRCFLYRKIFWSAVGSRTEKKLCKRAVYKIINLLPMGMVIKSYQRFIDAGQRKNAACSYFDIPDT